MPRRAFSFLLDKTVTIQRNTPGQDSAGSATASWSALVSNVRAGFQQKKKNEKTHDFAKDDGLSEFEWFFEEDHGARVGDRIVWSGKYYEIVGIPMDWTNDGLAFAPYAVKTLLRTA